MPNNTSRKARKNRLIHREPTYVTCLLVFGPPPIDIRRLARFKREIIDWWMQSIKSTPQPETDRSGHRFYARYMSWYHTIGKREVTTVVKEDDQ